MARLGVKRRVNLSHLRKPVVVEADPDYLSDLYDPKTHIRVADLGRGHRVWFDDRWIGVVTRVADTHDADGVVKSRVYWRRDDEISRNKRGFDREFFRILALNDYLKRAPR